MTPNEKNIVKALIAVAWADGRVEAPEASVIVGLLSGFDASQAEEDELLEYAQTARSLDQDLNLAALSMDDRELLLGNAALLARADGHLAHREQKVLERLIGLLGIESKKAEAILKETADGALRLSDRALEEQ
ncbi:MAG: TerB family tellurite resistance protein [Polyangiaceae bacterium]|nr:TerB family tellurite resistance protein [Polyangiaceae bacterium]